MAPAANSKPELATGAVYRRLARNSAYLAAGTASSALFMMLAVVLSARALSPREFGLLVLFQSATMMIASLMSFSTQQPVIKLGASAQAEGDRARLGRIIGLGLLFDALAAIIAALAAFAFLRFGRQWIGLEHQELGVATLFAASLLFTGYLTSNGIFRLLDRFGLLSMIQAGCAAGILAATAYLYASGAPFEHYCWAWAIFYALNGQIPLFAALYLARKAGIPVAFSTGRIPLLLDDLGNGDSRSSALQWRFTAGRRSGVGRGGRRLQCGQAACRRASQGKHRLCVGHVSGGLRTFGTWRT
jgi:O-antigen/teichoic acid export membrane protein